MNVPEVFDEETGPVDSDIVFVLPEKGLDLLSKTLHGVLGEYTDQFELGLRSDFILEVRV
jgi:hypothetical protein